PVPAPIVEAPRGQYVETGAYTAPNQSPSYTPPASKSSPNPQAQLVAELEAERAARQQLQVRANALEGELHRQQAAALADSGERIARQAAEAERDRMEQR